jgi:hypothetical protein
MKDRLTVLRVVIGAYLIGLGMLSGVVLDRMLFDRQRARMLHQYEDALRRWHGVQMQMERDGGRRR